MLKVVGCCESENETIFDCLLKTESVEVLACEVCITGSSLFASYCLIVSGSSESALVVCQIKATPHLVDLQ